MNSRVHKMSGSSNGMAHNVYPMVTNPEWIHANKWNQIPDEIKNLKTINSFKDKYEEWATNTNLNNPNSHEQYSSKHTTEPRYPEFSTIEQHPRNEKLT